MKCRLPHDFVIFDVETTGLSPLAGDRVVEFAAVKVSQGHIVERFQTLINPQREISFGAYQVNGISNAMVKGAPLAVEILPDVLNFMGDSCLIAHNIKFDLGFMNNELRLTGHPILEDRLTIDTVRMARSLIPELGSFSLANVAYFLGVEEKQQHRAMSDVEITYAVFCKLLEVADRKDICQLESLVNLFGVQKRFEDDLKLKVQAIADAIEAKQNLSILYYGANSATSVRKITPQKISKEGAAITVVGFCHLRKEERSFRVDRIVNIERAS